MITAFKAFPKSAGSHKKPPPQRYTETAEKTLA